MKRIFLVLLCCSAIALPLAGCRGQEEQGAAAASKMQREKAKYHCPMHPTYISDRPGACPICGMSLVLIEGHEDQVSKTSSQGIAGRVSVMIPAERRQQIGLSTTPVERRKLTRTIRATATVEYDETRWTQVNPRVGGWVQELYANYTGQHIEKGQPLLKLYSPELLTTEQEYLTALRTGEPNLIGAARRRLELWEIGADQIAELDQTGKASDTMILNSPATGHIITKDVYKGKSFMPGEKLYEIADLSHIWIRAFVYEYEMPLIKTGQTAVIRLSNDNNTLRAATVTFIYPNLEPLSRTLEVRLEADNPDFIFRPDMWANVEFEVDVGEGLVVPASAVIDTGKRYLAFVAKEDGAIEPRELKIGGRTDDNYLVRAGVSEGEHVVSRALFLVDSESQLKAAISGMGSAGKHKHGG